MSADDLTRRLALLRAAPDAVTLEGFHPLKHALRFGAEIELALAADPAAVRALAARLAPDLVEPLQRRLRPAAREVVAAALTRPLAPEVIAIARRPDHELEAVLAARRDRPVVLLEAPRHLGNVGAAIRVAAAADAAAVLTTGTQDPWAPAAIRGAAGLHYALPVLRVDELPVCGRPLIAVDPDGEPLTRTVLPAGAILAFGTERHGLSASLLARAEQRVGIPMRSGVSSLNLATAVAVVLFAAI